VNFFRLKIIRHQLSERTNVTVRVGMPCDVFC